MAKNPLSWHEENWIKKSQPSELLFLLSPLSLHSTGQRKEKLIRKENSFVWFTIVENNTWRIKGLWMEIVTFTLSFEHFLITSVKSPLTRSFSALIFRSCARRKLSSLSLGHFCFVLLRNVESSKEPSELRRHLTTRNSSIFSSIVGSRKNRKNFFLSEKTLIAKSF